MARGDFRSSIGQVISGSQRQVHNTSGTVPAFRPVRQSPNYLAEGALNAVGLVAKTLQDNKRQQEVEAERQKRKAEAEAERLKRQKESHNQSLDRHLYNKRYKANQEAMTSFVAQVAQSNPNDVYLSDAEFREKYADQLTSVNLEDIEDQEILDFAQLNEQEDLSILLNAARNGVEQAAEMKKYVALTDMSASENFEDIQEIYAAGTERGMSDQKIFAALTSSAYSAATQGNYDAAAVVKQFAVDNIKDPQLRDQIIGEMEPLVSRGTRNKVEYTKEARRAMNGARTLREVDEVISSFPEGTFTDDRIERAHKQAEARQYKDNFIQSATADFQNGKVSIDALYGRLTGTEVIDGERTNLEHTIKLTQEEVSEQMDLAFLSLMEQNPQAVPEVLKNSTRVPRVFSTAVKGFFQKGLSVNELGDLDFSGNDYAFVLQAIEAVDGKSNPFGSASIFSTKFGLEGEQKAIATLMFNQMSFMKADGDINVQEAMEMAMDTVRRGREFGSMYPEQGYTTALNDALEDESYPPEIRSMARNFLGDYKSYMAPEAAAEAAIKNATALSVEVGDKFIVNGREFMSAIEDNNAGLLKDYHDTDAEDLLDLLDDELDFSGEYATFRPVSMGNGRYHEDFSMLTIADSEGNRMTYSLRELQDKIADKFSDRHYQSVIKAQEGERSNVIENLPLSMRPDLNQPNKF